jgi:hypothetical protein
MINGFGCYLKYLAIKSHFTNEKYDYFKYKGKIKADTNSFNQRNDKFFFERIAKKLQSPFEVEKFFVSCMVKNTRTWIGDVFGDNVESDYIDWQRKIESITYVFEQDFQKIVDVAELEDIIVQNLFQVNEGQHPRILKMFLKKDISLETLVLLNLAIKGTFSYWNQNIHENILWPEIEKNCIKYQPFLLKYIGIAKVAHLAFFIFQKSSLTLS